MPLKARIKSTTCPLNKWENCNGYDEKGLAWLKARVSERTSWDGAVIIAGCLVIILTGGLAKVLAWIGLAYGLWTCYKEEK